MIETIESPWYNLPKIAPFVLPEDKEIIDAHNEKYVDQKSDFHFQTKVMPVPFIGDVFNSEIVILLHNPKYVDEWPKLETEEVRDKYKKVFNHTSDFPFFCLDPSLRIGENLGLGEKYWRDRLKDLVKHYGSWDTVLKRVSIIQFNPYSSVRFRPTKNLYSQEYNFYLVRKAIERKAHIILARGRKSWLKAVPELENYSYFGLNSDQHTAISANNCPSLFKKLGFMKNVEMLTTQSFIVYPIRRSKDEDNLVPVVNGGGRSFSNCKLEVKDGVAIFKSKDDEIGGVFSLNKFFVLSDYSSL